MIEWLSTKVAVGVAVLVVTASVVGYFAYQRSLSQDSEVADAAEALARYVETFAALGGEVRTTVSVGEGGNYALPAAIGGEAVQFNISRSLVVVTRGGLTAAEPHSVPQIHIWQFQNHSINSSEMAALDLAHPWTGAVSGGGVFVLERREVRVSGDDQLLTFCYVVDDS